MNEDERRLLGNQLKSTTKLTTKQRISFKKSCTFIAFIINWLIPYHIVKDDVSGHLISRIKMVFGYEMYNKNLFSIKFVQKT